MRKKETKKTGFFTKLKDNIHVLSYFLKLTHRLSPSCIPLMAARSIFGAMTPIINVLIPKFIIDELMGQQRVKVFVVLILAAAIINGLLYLVNEWLRLIGGDAKCLEMNERYRQHLCEKIMDLDFQDLEDPQVLNLKEKAAIPVVENGNVWGLISGVTGVVTSVLAITGLIAIISTLNALLIMFIVAVILVNMLLYRRVQKLEYEARQSIAPLDREEQYYDRLTSDFSYGKDLRLYGARYLVMQKIHRFNLQVKECFADLFNRMGRYDGVIKVNSCIQAAAVYGYMAYSVVKNIIGIGSFAMYVGAANNFSKQVTELLNQLVWVGQVLQYFKKFFEFEHIPPRLERAGKTTEHIEKCNITFKNVSFRYPRGEENILRHVNITIQSGETLSVVGLNGAGKTTFIKLLARLYDPDEGEILLNGVNIKEYAYEEYQNLLSVVFQDFKTLALTVRENVALGQEKETSDELIWDALRRSGLLERVEELPQGLDSYVYKIFDESGVEFSGGQNQKLALARAIFKNAPIVILDEPTAALDPLAEYEIYSRFHEMVGIDKTTIYISHRLSSCRFCDKIAVFHEGTISQYGTHEQLVQEDGQYRKMYEAQAQYYV